MRKRNRLETDWATPVSQRHFIGMKNEYHVDSISRWDLDVHCCLALHYASDKRKPFSRSYVGLLQIRHSKHIGSALVRAGFTRARGSARSSDASGDLVNRADSDAAHVG